jgi:mono/diheme cytochrome c family protein
MRAALAVVSLVVLIASGLVVYDGLQSRWQDTQKDYFQQALVHAKSPTERAALAERTPRIEQTMVTAFGDERIDRCRSCHIAVDDPNFTTAGEPLRTHPYSAEMGDVYQNGRWERRHKFSDFGCTSCHGGQGHGLEKADAHGEDEMWPAPMLGFTIQKDWKPEIAAHLRDTDYIQANCAQCHADKDFPGTAWVARGRELFFEKGCFGCHRIEGLSSGTIGPDLTEEGKERKLDYLWGHIVNPRDYTPTSIMPKFKLTDDERKALVIFLKSRRGTTSAESPVAQYELDVSTVPPVPESVAAVESNINTAATPAARGEQLIEGYACLSCHKLGDKDGGISPDLSYEGLMRDDDWLMAHFQTPRSRIPDSNMPVFGLPDEDYQAMAAYLLTRTAPPPAMAPADTYKTLCARCHGENGDGKGITSIYLDPAPRNLTSAEFMATKPRERFIDSIHKGVPGTSMPPWGKALSDDQINGVLDHVWAAFVREKPRTLSARNVPDVNPVPMSQASIDRGEATFMARCTGCHGKKADGKGPNSLDISPRPRNLRNFAFINSVSDHRLFESITYGVEGTAMPSWIDYGLQKNDIGDLVNFIRSLNKAGN